MRELETWKKCAKENVVDDLKCLPCDIVFISLPVLMQHLESPSHREMAITFKELQEKKKSSSGYETHDILDLTTEEEGEPMDTSDSSVVVQVDSSMPLPNDDTPPALEEITHLNNIPLEDIMIMKDN